MFSPISEAEELTRGGLSGYDDTRFPQGLVERQKLHQNYIFDAALPDGYIIIFITTEDSAFRRTV
jgi:hypothetical protein